MLPPVLPKCISNKAGKACNNHGLVNHTQTNPETQREGIAGVGVANRCLNMRCSPCVANALCTCIGIALATDNVVGNVTDGDSTKNHLGLACCEPSRLGGSLGVFCTTDVQPLGIQVGGRLPSRQSWVPYHLGPIGFSGCNNIYH